jgi:hypothetical protein
MYRHPLTGIRHSLHLPLTQVKIGHLADFRNKRVRVFGWVHRLRQQAQMTFITLRDGTGYLQLVLTGDLAKTLDALDLVTECTIEVTGELKAVPEGKSAPGGHELAADWWRIIGKAPSGTDSYASMFNEVSQISTRTVVLSASLILILAIHSTPTPQSVNVFDTSTFVRKPPLPSCVSELPSLPPSVPSTHATPSSKSLLPVSFRLLWKEDRRCSSSTTMVRKLI